MTSTPVIESVAGQVAAVRADLHAVWLLAQSVLVLLALSGFAVLNAGLVRAKNVAHTTAMVLLAASAGTLGFWLLGFGIENGGHGFFFSPTATGGAATSTFVLHASLAMVVATIPAGAMAERSRLTVIMVLSFVVAALLVPVYSGWAWGGGWLARLQLGHGVVDYAGSGVVHMTGGAVALVAAKLLGPRLGKYTLRGDSQPIPAHSMPMVVLGSLLLAAGWVGLAGVLAAGRAESLAGAMMVHTLLAAASGALWAFVHTRLRFGKPDLSMICNGFLAGLVAISAAGPFVASVSAVAVGAGASLLALEGALLVERRLRIDDPAGAVAVHGIGGAWGLLAVGIFADGRAGDGWNGVAGPVKGLLAGSGGQLLASLVGILANLVWVVPVTALLLWLTDRIVGNRAVADDEVAGLDVPELGMTGYVGETVRTGAARGGELGFGGSKASSGGAAAPH